MATPVIMPRQGQSVESCIIGKWHKKKGDTVKEGDVLFTYETDKATFEETSKVSGVLLDVWFEAGDDVPCLTNVCVIGNPGEDTSAFRPNAEGSESSTNTASTSEPAASQTPSEPAAAQPAASDTELLPVQSSGFEGKISPRAKNLARKNDIDYRYAVPSGPNGRIIERDIQALLDKGLRFTKASAELSEGTPGIEGTGLGGRITTEDILNARRAAYAAPASTVPASASASAALSPVYEEYKLPNIRKVIAKTMQASLSNSAQLTLNTSFDATAIMEYRKILKGSQDNETAGITLNDMIIYAVARTLVNHKMLNAHYLDDKMHLFQNAHIGVAVDTDRGLMVPTVMNADLKSLSQISAEVKQLAEECRAGTINPDKLKNGSFTVTNLGTLGIESFTPVLNPPQTGILGVNTIEHKVKEVDGQIKLYPSMTLSLTFDHRALDGSPAARFLKELKTNLEQFTVLLAR